MEKNSLSFPMAVGYLTGSLESKKVSFEQFEDFCSKESEIVFGDPHLEADPGTVYDLQLLAHSIAQIVSDQNINPERMNEALYNFGVKVAHGEITAENIALLCGLELDAFDI